MPTPEAKLQLLELLYAHSTAMPSEKAAAAAELNAALDKALAGTVYSRQQLRDILYRNGYSDYARRHRQQEQSGF